MDRRIARCSVIAVPAFAALPDGAKVDQAKAKFHNGVLEVTIPVPEQQNNRRTIPVEGESGVSSKQPQSQAA